MDSMMKKGKNEKNSASSGKKDILSDDQIFGVISDMKHITEKLEALVNSADLTTMKGRRIEQIKKKFESWRSEVEAELTMDRGASAVVTSVSSFATRLKTFNKMSSSPTPAGTPQTTDTRARKADLDPTKSERTLMNEQKQSRNSPIPLLTPSPCQSPSPCQTPSPTSGNRKKSADSGSNADSKATTNFAGRVAALKQQERDTVSPIPKKNEKAEEAASKNLSKIESTCSGKLTAVNRVSGEANVPVDRQSSVKKLAVGLNLSMKMPSSGGLLTRLSVARPLQFDESENKENEKNANENENENEGEQDSYLAAAAFKRRLMQQGLKGRRRACAQPAALICETGYEMAKKANQETESDEPVERKSEVNKDIPIATTVDFLEPSSSDGGTRSTSASISEKLELEDANPDRKSVVEDSLAIAKLSAKLDCEAPTREKRESKVQKNFFKRNKDSPKTSTSKSRRSTVDGEAAKSSKRIDEDTSKKLGEKRSSKQH